jgi:23S rRNA (cytidine1920-2'-O)/16S rRNA (cytidine1409-2'-O)-methyltransferase
MMAAAEAGSGRERLDRVLVERGLAPTRAKARALILAGRVLSGHVRLDKPGQRVARDADLHVREGRRWVSRGAPKLAAALRDLAVDPRDRDALDVGASTGGFTQVLLQAGARRVVALDVGRGQLDWSLRTDPRVHVLDGVNARHLEPCRLPWVPHLAVIDVSFISLRLVLPPVAACLGRGGEIVALVKPQFEVGRGRVGRGGIVRDRRAHRDVLERLCDFARAEHWGVAGLCAAALRGAEGNQEYFMHLKPDTEGLGTVELDRGVREVTADGGGAPA